MRSLYWSLVGRLGRPLIDAERARCAAIAREGIVQARASQRAPSTKDVEGERIAQKIEAGPERGFDNQSRVVRLSRAAWGGT